METVLRQLVMDMMADEDLKARAMADPAAVLGERGVALPAGHKVVFVANTPGVTHVVLPMAKGGGAGTEALGQRTSKLLGLW